MKLRRERLPIKIRLNSSLTPAKLLTISTRGSFNVDGFTVALGYSRPDGFGAGGDGLFHDVRLNATTILDIFVYDPTRGDFQINAPRELATVSLQPGSMFYLKLSWTGVSGTAVPGEARLLWTHDEMISGKAPRLATGQEVAAVDRFTETKFDRVSSQLLGIKRRVHQMTQSDIRSRARREKLRLRMQDAVDAPDVASLRISGFRGFRETGELRLAKPKSGMPGSGLTVVVGANNAGKSSLWEGFDAIARARRSGLSFAEGLRNRGTPEGVLIQLERTDGSTCSIRSIDPDSSETITNWEPPGPASPELPTIVVLPSRRYFRAAFHRSGGGAPDWMTQGGQAFSRFQERDTFTSRLFDLHSNPHKKEKFDKLLETVVGQRINWKIDLADNQNGGSYYLKVSIASDIQHSSEGLGDGIISLIFILDALYDPEPNSIIVIDEPELSLHPQLIRRLGEEIARVAAKRQVVIFTHSPLLISWDHIEAGAEIARVYKEDGASRIAQLPREVSKAISKLRGGWKNPHTLGVDANAALFLDDKVIVVEGQEDVGLLPVVYRETGVNPGGTLFGWGSGGGDGNPSRIVDLLATLGFRKVVALLDNDKPDEIDAINQVHPEFLALSIPAADIRDKPKEGKHGLLDERGKILKPELLEATRAVLDQVKSYLDAN